MSKFKKIVLILITIIIVLIMLAVGGAYFKLSKVQRVTINENNLGVSEQVKKNLASYRNIAILGIDSREDSYSKGNRSDCIIIASINDDTKEIKLISVYRDTYVQIEGHGLDKITHAYSYGSAELALNTLNTNFDLNIKEFITINFDAVKEIIDSIGGISMVITDEEVKHIPGISKGGVYNLSGEQTLAYARIRHAEGGDHKRTERMRDVLAQTVNKVKTFDALQLNNLVDTLFPKVYTNIAPSEIIGLIPSASSYRVKESIGWPYETEGATIDKIWYGIPITLESNVIQLHKEAFKEANYVPSETVKQISNSIIEQTGYNNQ